MLTPPSTAELTPPFDPRADYKRAQVKKPQQRNRWGVWQSLKKGTRQHFGNRTVVFTNLDHDVLLAVFQEDFKLHEFEFEPALRDQLVEYVVQSMDLELEERLNDPVWRGIYLNEYEMESTDFSVALGPDEGGKFLRFKDSLQVDCDGSPFVETVAVYTTGVLNCDTQEWKASVV